MSLQEILLTNLGEFLATLNQVFGIAAQNTVAWTQNFGVTLLATYTQTASILLDALEAILPPY
ncbi:MAG: hypothetical protein AMXMBFR82_28070 [Candidatus Hydrogenedentota bacterium]